MTTCPIGVIIDDTAATVLTADGVTEDPAGVAWSISSLDGWWDSAPVKAVIVDAQPQGQVITVARRQPRAVVVELLAHPPLAVGETLATTALGNLCFDAIDTIKETLRRATFAQHALYIDDGSVTGTLHAGFLRVRPVLCKIVGAKTSVRAQFSILTADPYLYDGANQPYD